MDTAAHAGLPIRTGGVLVVLALAGVEVGTRVGYHTRDGLLQKAEHFADTAEGSAKNLVILGTCLPEQHIRADLLQDRIGGGWTVYNLGNQATSSLDWYLALAHELPPEKVQALVVAYGDRDLASRISPWESRVTELAAWSDMPDLDRWVCDDGDCRTDLWMRKASTTWRYRVRIANRAWDSLGALAREAPLAPPLVEGEADDAAAASLFYTDKLLQTAKAEGIPVYMVPLQHRPSPADKSPDRVRQDEAWHQRVDPILAASGATALTLPPLEVDLFTDETHLTEAGSITLTRGLAAALREQFGLEEPPDVVVATGPQGAPLGPDGKPIQTTQPKVDGAPALGSPDAAVGPAAGVGVPAGVPGPAAPTVAVVGAPAPGSPVAPGPSVPQGPALGSASGAQGPANPAAPQPSAPVPAGPPLGSPAAAQGPPIPHGDPNAPAYIPPPPKPEGPPLK